MDKRKRLLASLPLVADMVARSHGVKVQIGQVKTPCRHDKTIYLPALDPDDDKCIAEVRGYIDHEAGHVRYTESGLKREASTKFAATLYNVIEDVRIEGLLSREYAGCRRNLDYIWSGMELTDEQRNAGKISYADPAQPEWKLGDIAIAHVAQWGRAYLIGQTKPMKTTAATEALFRSKFGDQVTDDLNKALLRMRNLKDARSALALAEELQTYLNAHLPPETPPHANTPKPAQPPDTPQGTDSMPTPGAGGQGGDNTDDDATANATASGSGDDSGDADDDQDASDEGDGLDAGSDTVQSTASTSDTKADGSPSSDDGATTGGSGNGTSPSPLTVSDGVTPWDMVPGELEQASAEAVDENRAVGQQKDTYGSSHYASTNALGNPPTLEAVLGATALLRGRLAGLLQAEKLEPAMPSVHGRRLISRKLTSALLGDPRVFARKEMLPDVNTIVGLLLDRSTSMSSRMSTASGAVLACSLAMHAIPDTRVVCHAFPGINTPTVPITPLGGNPRMNLPKFGIVSSGGTPMGEALWEFARLMGNEPEPRKIIMVATDGEPGDEEKTKDIVRRLTNAGFEVMGIGIGATANVEGFFPSHCTIGSVNELVTAMFSMLSRALLKKPRAA